MNNCRHNKTSFGGHASMIGGYFCDDCNFRIDPVIEHRRKGFPHILFNKNKEEDLKKYLSKLPQEQLDLLK